MFEILHFCADNFLIIYLEAKTKTKELHCMHSKNTTCCMQYQTFTICIKISFTPPPKKKPQQQQQKQQQSKKQTQTNKTKRKYKKEKKKVIMTK